jgi:Fe-S-cluster containining protein
MRDKSTIADKVSHSEVCLECEGVCCRTYPGSMFDSGEIKDYLDKNRATAEKVKELLARRLSASRSVSYDEALKGIETCLDQTMLLIHSNLLIMNQEANQENGFAQKRCLFYDKDKGCLVYEARPEKCKTYICPKIDGLFKPEETK